VVTPGTDVVTMEFTRDNEVEFTLTVSGHAWRSFCRLSQRREVEPTVWLSQLLGYGMVRESGGCRDGSDDIRPRALARQALFDIDVRRERAD